MGSRRRPATTLALALLCFYHAPRRAFSLSFSLDFFDAGAGLSIIVAGDALVNPPALQLTKNSRASYRYKVPLWNGATGEMASFATAFSFRIAPEKDSLPQQAGDGMTFFLGHFPSVAPDSSSAGGLGLLPAIADGTDGSQIVVVEFDAFLNHVGIGVSSVNSTAASAYTTTSWPGKNLTSSSVMEATVNYHNGSRMLAVDLALTWYMAPSASPGRTAPPLPGCTGYCRGRSVPPCRSRSGKHLRLLNLVLFQPAAATATRR